MKTVDLNLIEGGDPIRRQAAAWFSRLRADDVTENDQRQWQRWLATDPRHRAAYERIERLWSGFGEHAPHPEIALRLHADDPVTKFRLAKGGVGRHYLAGFMVAAALALAVVANWPRLPAQTPGRHYSTAVGEHQTLVLEDGSRVSLDTDTRLHVRFSKDERWLSLERGRAFFRVAKERRPLSVHTSNGSVRAVGTEFEVYRHDDDLEVTLIEGRVQLLSQEPSPRTLATLEAGQKARFGKRQTAPLIEAVALGSMPAWLSGRLVLDDEPLAMAVAEFNRYTQQPIVLGSDALARLRVSGVFRSDDSHAFVEALRGAYPITATPGPAGETVLSERR